ncbi:MAG: triose-phosphate isomerase [Rickettsiales bacterium]|nr:triose-phosphate isomerase [Rickettsiales bacterium]
MIKIISGNWKMNGSKSELDTWFKDFFEKAVQFEKDKKSNHMPDILLCIPSIYIQYASELAEKYNSKTKTIRVHIGAENCHQENKGAFTGNISPLMLKEFGVKYTLVGHSERRQSDFETNELVAKKAISALNGDITPIICVGESLEIREAKEHLDFIKKQVLNSTNGVDLEKSIIAYEPVWAIGTGKVPTLDEIDEMNSHIKKILSKKSGLDEDKINVLYGGSVKSSNVKDIATIKSVNGVLVGGASLKGEEFFNIVINTL